MSADQSEANVPTLAESLEAAFDANVAEPVDVAAEIETQVDEKIAASEVDSSESVSDDAVVEVESESVSPPEHWSDEDKEAFTGMDEGGREWALRLEANASKGIEKKSAELKKFSDALQPYKHLFPEGSEIQAMEQLFNAQASLQRNPVEGIKWLMKSYGVDEKQFAPSTEVVDEFADPEITKLRAELEEMKGISETNAQNAQNTQRNEMIAEINQFREAEQDGQLLHPHFNAISGVMSGLMQSGRADSLDKAYEQAVWSLPEYRDEVVKQKADEKAKADREERTRKATAAEKKAAGVNGKSSKPKAKAAKTLKESLSDAYDESVRG